MLALAVVCVLLGMAWREMGVPRCLVEARIIFSEKEEWKKEEPSSMMYRGWLSIKGYVYISLCGFMCRLLSGTRQAAS